MRLRERAGGARRVQSTGISAAGFPSASSSPDGSSGAFPFPVPQLEVKHTPQACQHRALSWPVPGSVPVSLTGFAGDPGTLGPRTAVYKDLWLPHRGQLNMESTEES